MEELTGAPVLFIKGAVGDVVPRTKLTNQETYYDINRKQRAS